VLSFIPPHPLHDSLAAMRDSGLFALTISSTPMPFLSVLDVGMAVGDKGDWTQCPPELF